MGPTTKAISVTGGITFDELIDHFRDPGPRPDRGRRRLPAARDRRRTRATSRRRCSASSRPSREIGWRDPGRGLGHDRAHGHDARRPGRRGALRLASMHADLLYVGLNCATGPEFMTDHMRTLSAHARTTLVACVPNAGLPDEDGQLPRDAGAICRACSTASSTTAGSTSSAAAAARTPAHIRALARAGRGQQAPRGPGDPPQTPALRHRAPGGRRRQPAGPRGRAHQRPRQPQVQAAHRRRGATTRRPRSRAPRSRTARRSSTSASQDPDRDEIGRHRTLSSSGRSAWSRRRS